MSLLGYIPGCFAVRVHGRRWLKITKPSLAPPERVIGWRAITWTDKLDEAEKFGSRIRAERFAQGQRCPFEIVDLDKPSHSIPGAA